MSTHRKQHFVAKSYLEAWTDPDCPSEQKPYVWRFDKDGTNPRAKAPKNIFHETDMYTITGVDGGRDLTLEHGLSGLETEFARLRERLAKQEALDPTEHVLVCAFIATAHARTRVRREHWRQQWQRPLEIMDDLVERLKTATPEQKRAWSSVPSLSSGASLSHEQVRRLVAKPTQALLWPAIRTVTPLLAKLDFLVVETDDELGFITSDHPCVWYDPEGYKRAPLYRAPAIMYPSIQITFPVSPRQLILLNRAGEAGYSRATSILPVQDLNRRTRFFSGEHFVVRKKHTEPIWFEVGEIPDDSWENRHAKELELREQREDSECQD